LTPLQSTTVSRPPHASRRRAPSLGLRFPLRDISWWRPYDGFPRPSRSVLGVSHALDGLFRHLPRGFVSPHSHVQGLPSRGFCFSHSRTTSSVARALSSFDDPALPTVSHRRHALSPRPQGFHPCRESGAGSAVFSRRYSPIPSWASPPPGCSLSASRVRLHALGRSWSWRRVRRVVLLAALQRSYAEPGLPLSRLPTC